MLKRGYRLFLFEKCTSGASFLRLEICNNVKFDENFPVLAICYKRQFYPILGHFKNLGHLNRGRANRGCRKWHLRCWNRIKITEWNKKRQEREIFFFHI